MFRRSLAVCCGVSLVGFGSALAQPGSRSAVTAESAFSFVVIGHIRGPTTGASNFLLEELLGEVRELDPDLVFVAGDIIWGDYDRTRADSAAIVRDWNRVDSLLARLEVPVFRVPGNHDINDPVTRDIYFDRYGRLPQAVDFKGARFLLLNSAYVPPGADSASSRRPFIGGHPLGADQIAFIKRSLAPFPAPRHIFLLMHHTLWWRDDAPWWTDVHPFLQGSNTRAVFGGDFGPLKFSHMHRDGIDYLQTSIEGRTSLKRLRSWLSSRLLSQQFDNFLLVRVGRDSARVEVRTVGAVSGGRYTPQQWRAVEEPPPRSVIERMRELIGTPRRLIAIAVALGAAFCAGALAAVLWNRWSKS